MTMSLPNTDSMKHGPEWLRQMNDLNSEGAHITTPLSAKSNLTKSSVYGRYSRLHDKQYSIEKLISVWAPSIEAPVELKLYEDIFDPGNMPITPISMKAFIEKEKKQADESAKESIIGNSKTNHNRSTRPGNSRGGATGNITGSIGGPIESNSTSRSSNAFSSSSTATRGGGARRGGRWQAGNSLNEEDEPNDMIGNKTNRQAQTAYFRGGRGRAGFRGGSRGGGAPVSGSAGHQFINYDDNIGGMDRNYDEGPAGDESDDDRVGSDSSGGGEWQQVGGTHTRQRQISQNSIESNEIDKLRNKSGSGGGGGNSKSVHINDSSISTMRTNANNAAATTTTATGSVSGNTTTTGTGNTINWRQRTRSGGDKQPHTTPTSQSNQNSRRLFHPVNSSSTADHQQQQQQQRSPHQRSFSGGEHQNFFNRRSRNSSRTDDIVLENFYEEQPTENESVNLTDPNMSVAHHHHQQQHHSHQRDNKSTTSPVNVDILAAQIKELASKSGGFNENELKQVLQRCLSAGSQSSLGNINNATNTTNQHQQQSASLSSIDPAIIANKVKKLQSSHSMEDSSLQHVQHDPTGHGMIISWYYLDPKGSMHGPYSNENMRQWLASGYFTDSLQLRRSCDLQFLPLSFYKDLCKPNNPFLDDLIIPPITSLLSPVVQQQQTPSTGADETTSTIASAEFESRNKHQTKNHSDLFGAPGLHFGSPEGYFVPPRTSVAVVPPPNIMPSFHPSQQHSSQQQAMNLLVVDKAVLAVSTVAPPPLPASQQQQQQSILSSNHASTNNSIVTGTSSSTVGVGVGSGSSNSGGGGAIGLVHSLSIENSNSKNVIASEFLPSMFTSYEPVNSFPYDVASASSTPIWPNVAQANSCFTHHHHQVTLNVNATDETLTAIQDMVSNSIWGNSHLETHTTSSVEESTTSGFLNVQQQQSSATATNDTSQQQQALLKHQHHDVLIKKAKVKKSTQKVAVVPVQKKLGDVDEDKQRLWEEAYRLRVDQENQQRLKRMAEEVEQRALTLAEEQAFEEGERLREWEQIKAVHRVAEERRREDERLAQLPQLPSTAKWAAAVGGGGGCVGSVAVAPTGSSHIVTPATAAPLGSNVQHIHPPNLLHIQRMEQIQANTSTQQQQSISSSTSTTSSSYLTSSQQQQSSSAKRPDNLRSVWNAVPTPNVVVKSSPSITAAPIPMIPPSGTKTLAEIQAEELQREMELKRQQALELGLQHQQQHGGNMHKQQPLLWASKVKQGNIPNVTSPPAPTIAANVVVPSTIQSSSSLLLPSPTPTPPPQQQQQLQPVLSIWGSAPLPASNSVVVTTTTTAPKKATETSRPGDVSQRKAPVGGSVGVGGTTTTPAMSLGKMNKEEKKKNELNTLRNVMKESLPLSPLLQWARGRISELSVSGGAFDVAALIEIASAMPDDDEVIEMFKQYLDDSESVRSFSLEFLERRRELQRTGDRNNEWITATSHRTATKGGEVKQKEQQQTQSKATPSATTSTKKKKKISKAANQSVRIQ